MYDAVLFILQLISCELTMDILYVTKTRESPIT